jgi:hypothetical protein
VPRSHRLAEMAAAEVEEAIKHAQEAVQSHYAHETTSTRYPPKVKAALEHFRKGNVLLREWARDSK